MLFHIILLSSLFLQGSDQEGWIPATDPRFFDTLIWPPPGEVSVNAAKTIPTDNNEYFSHLLVMVMDLQEEIASLKKNRLMKDDIDLMRDQIGNLHNDVNTWQERMTNFVRKDLGDLDYRLRINCTGKPVRVKGTIKKTKKGPLIHLNVRPISVVKKQEPTRGWSLSWIWRSLFCWW